MCFYTLVHGKTILIIKSRPRPKALCRMTYLGVEIKFRLALALDGGEWSILCSDFFTAGESAQGTFRTGGQVLTWGLNPGYQPVVNYVTD
jgi:hypothetical protein